MTDSMGNEGTAPTDPAGLGTAFMRTLVPLLVSLVVTVAARAGLDVDDGTRQAITAFIGPLVASGYYIIVRELERRWAPAGWLLGSPHAPVYPSKAPAPVSVDEGLTLPFGGEDAGEA